MRQEKDTYFETVCCCVSKGIHFEIFNLNNLPKYRHLGIRTDRLKTAWQQTSNMSFHFQQPGMVSLLTEIDNASINASSGGGIFAFATKIGISRLLESPNVARLLNDGNTFNLVVGMDAITNAASLICLEDFVEHYNGALVVHAFLHTLPGTFHPKFCWFRADNNLKIITGSGNLTGQGLGPSDPAHTTLGNWEAFIIQSLDDPIGITVLENIQTWIEENITSENLLEITNEAVKAAAIENSRTTYKKPTRTRIRTPLNQTTEEILPPITAIAQVNNVLIRELPRTRPGQADIGRDGLMFFGFNGVPIKVLLQYVAPDNTLGEITEQRLFVNASQNYRLELGIIAELGYEVDVDDNRMVLVAVRLDESSFRFTIIPVTDPNYNQILTIIGPQTGARRTMRKIETDTVNLQLLWPETPNNLLPITVFSIES